jgi:hypothetical protein
MVGWTNNKHANSTAIPVMNIGQYCSICCLCLVLTVSLAVTDHQIRLLLVDLRECCKGMVRSKPSPKITFGQAEDDPSGYKDDAEEEEIRHAGHGGCADYDVV